jgi:hypothetical protein
MQSAQRSTIPTQRLRGATWPTLIVGHRAIHRVAAGGDSMTHHYAHSADNICLIDKSTRTRTHFKTLAKRLRAEAVPALRSD